MNKNFLIIILIIILIVLAGGIYFLFQNQKTTLPEEKQNSPKDTSVESQSDSLESSEETLSTGSEQETQQEQKINPVSYEIQGMKIDILKEGTGEASKKGDVVFVHYVGTLKNGQKFDSSIDRDQPFSFTLGENMVIQGWELGVLGMKVGEKRKLTIPPELGYGNQGAGGVIPPVSTLIFEIELIGIN
ncbi:MAG: FKBP-type peptidyl-prolyl cis-trans isomerase [bacterium]|nr:FKBP-type peptidyl-prolyl cis-trans isomerase [bacterium]